MTPVDFLLFHIRLLIGDWQHRVFECTEDIYAGSSWSREWATETAEQYEYVANELNTLEERYRSEVDIEKITSALNELAKKLHNDIYDFQYMSDNDARKQVSEVAIAELQKLIKKNS